ncbi:DUF397 domain-containing protein [Streptomyces olivochromogenes]|uniref:DUF397 domain-containing protein n=1 Tax=Streptomyces olivochromogenes TaxID=1963 RepID=UPI001F2174F0|nr:DUF397 domain-containing protein [Streptomyces olivochromogenes]MCF3132434.1 DUF397 domain-containing protein [Streptomyces olivochromogenes]
MARGLPLTGWHTSSHRCGEFDNACVEVARSHDGVAVRDSKAPDLRLLAISAPAWHAFLALSRRTFTQE